MVQTCFAADEVSLLVVKLPGYAVNVEVLSDLRMTIGLDGTGLRSLTDLLGVT